jgi:hypothetical protein
MSIRKHGTGDVINDGPIVKEAKENVKWGKKDDEELIEESEAE